MTECKLKPIWWRDPIGDVPSIAIVSVTGVTLDELSTIFNSHAALVAKNSELLNIIHLVGAQCGCGSTENAIRLIINTVREAEKIFYYKYDEPKLTGDKKKG